MLTSLCLFLLSPAAKADGVLYYYGNGGGSTWLLDSSVSGALATAGASVVDQTDSWPLGFSGYRLVILAPNDGATTAYSKSQLADLQSFLDDDGVLILMGENQYFPESNSAFTDVVAALGGSMTFSEGTQDTGCDHVATLEATSHPLLDGITDLYYAAPGDLDVGDGTLLASGESGQGLVGVEGRIVATSDMNLWVDSCDIDQQNIDFMLNIYDAACDWDGDGADGTHCGGGDCDDSDSAVSPDAKEVWYDGFDQDCDGASDYDQDGDGFDIDDDCDDEEATTYPGAAEVWYDGIDQNCDGASDYDQDGDGFDLDDDCDDEDGAVYPGAEEIWYDGTDQDCDGASDDDQDGDGFDLGDDCDDEDATISPDAEDIVGDGIDQDCDGADAVEASDTGAGEGDDGGKSGCSAVGSAGGWGLIVGLMALLGRRRRG